jgi:nicotinamide-nucleotide amidase
MSRHEIKELYADKVFEELAKLINVVHSSSNLCCDPANSSSEAY